MATAPDLQTVVGDPAWLCHRYNEQADAFHYRRVERGQHRAVPFLTDRDLGGEVPPVVVG